MILGVRGSICLIWARKHTTSDARLGKEWGDGDGKNKGPRVCAKKGECYFEGPNTKKNKKCRIKRLAKRMDGDGHV